MTLKLLFSVLAYMLLFLVALMGGGYIYSAFFEEPWLSYREMPFAVHGPVTAGGPASSHVIRCNSTKTSKSYTTTRGFQKMGANAPPILLPSLDLTVEPGCEKAISRINIVPDGTLPGWYRFTGTAAVHGFLVWHEVQWGTNFFEVVAAPIKNTEIVLVPSGPEVKLEIVK